MERAIQELNSNPEYVKLKGSAASAQLRNRYFGRTEAERIDELTGGKFFSTNQGYFEIGGDFGNMFDGACHSTCLIGLRDASLPYQFKGAVFDLLPPIARVTRHPFCPSRSAAILQASHHYFRS